jgi:hypothetical protein
MPSRSRPPDGRDVSEKQRSDQSADPGAFIGSEPEREAETIPGGVDRQDQRTSASNSRPGVDGEPEDRYTRRVVEGDIGSASLKEPVADGLAADLEQLTEAGDR